MNAENVVNNNSPLLWLRFDFLRMSVRLPHVANGGFSEAFECAPSPLLAGRRLWDKTQTEGSNTKEPLMDTSTAVTVRQPWNKGKLVGQKTPSNLRRYGRFG